MTDLYVRHIPSKDPRLGRHVCHDPRSRGFAAVSAVDTSTWRSRRIRVYDPRPNPNQEVGCCTMVAKAVQFNAHGNRRKGVVLNMDWVLAGYRIETRLDEYRGAWEPDDTGSSSIASCKTAQKTGDGGTYRWFFGADQVVQGVMDGLVINIGSDWTTGMFNPDADGRIEPTGQLAGGHEWAVRGYDVDRDWVMGRCWWGPDFRDFWIKREHLADLLSRDGDAHHQQRLQPAA